MSIQLYLLLVCRDDASEASHTGDDRAATYRLLEPISHPSRAEDLDDLRRLQKSSTKPRKGALRQQQLMAVSHSPDDFPEI